MEYYDINQPHGLSGLQNIGNTCYMNSIIQALSSLNLFRSYLLTNQHLNVLVNKAGANKKTRSECQQYIENSIVHRLSNLFKLMWNQNRVVVPEQFKKIISIKDKMFLGYHQHDSQELLNMLLDSIHDELKVNISIVYENIDPNVEKFMKLKRRYLQKEKDNTLGEYEKIEFERYFKEFKNSKAIHYVNGSYYIYWENYIKKSYSIITRLFTGTFLSIIQCMRCYNRSESFEPFNILSVELKNSQKVITLDECLDSFTTEEILDGDNKYYCSECKQYNKAVKKIVIWKAPEILIIQLKRFKNYGDVSMKINTNVEIPLIDFDISKYMSQNDVTDKYMLQSISSHMGTCRGGHYTAHCRNPNNEWYEFDDGKVEHNPIDENDEHIISNNAYILFYVKQQSPK